ncbi:MAG: DUF1684 domain-containing protein [Acidobacteriota bacterium]|nr:MAG: DUF1684 domain-containing protein [Acidobacteriota bacterium]
MTEVDNRLRAPGELRPPGRRRPLRASAGALTLALLAGAAGCTGSASESSRGLSEPPSGLEFLSEEEVLAYRAERDEWCRNDPESPIPRQALASFEGLEYYPFNPDLRFKVRLERYDDPVPQPLITTTGEVRPAVKLGWVGWSFRGQHHRLAVYQLRDLSAEVWGDMFLAFVDETTGRETYGAGRYLELEGGQGDWYVLDFNMAYYPYCAYGGSGYRCPKTPPENRLPFAVHAGERGGVDHERPTG